MIRRTVSLSLCLLCASIATAAQCPKLTVSAPDTVNEGQPITFTLTVAGGAAAKINWTISAGTIASGQGTRTITVGSTGIGDTVTATVEVGGLSQDCVSNASSTAFIEKRPVARKFDEFGIATADELAARLDNFVIELQNEPLAKAYVIAYRGQKGAAATTATWLKILQTYLVKTRGVDASRIVAVDGGLRAEPANELWIVPEGATPPQAKPTMDPTDIKAQAKPAATQRKPASTKKP